MSLNIHEYLLTARKEGHCLSMVTCYDASFAEICQEAEIDILLVGDSVANAVLGHEKTAQIGMMEMLHHTAAVRRGSPTSRIVTDLPFGSDDLPDQAVPNGLALKSAGADAVKIEGAKLDSVRALVAAGVPVVGHLGLLPQTATSLKQAGKTPEEAAQILKDALDLAQAGASAIVLEHIPSQLAAEITAKLDIPTIGIGAGGECSGQVLVMHDLLGLSLRRPPFAKAFVDLRKLALEGLTSYKQAVKTRQFP
jgi:3-methyl-2-oxobutanoate hydroxymethyltransferase